MSWLCWSAASLQHVSSCCSQITCVHLFLPPHVSPSVLPPPAPLLTPQGGDSQFENLCFRGKHAAAVVDSDTTVSCIICSEADEAPWGLVVYIFVQATSFGFKGEVPTFLKCSYFILPESLHTTDFCFFYLDFYRLLEHCGNKIYNLINYSLLITH